MHRFSSPISLRRLNSLLSMALLAIIAIVLAYSATIFVTNERASAAWTDYSRSKDEPTVVLGEIYSSLGFGGLIHEFKGAVLRGGSGRVRRAQNASLNVLAKLEKLETLMPEAAEQIGQVREVVHAYQSAINVVKSSRDGPAETDRQIRVDDAPALAALEALRAQIGARFGAANKTYVHDALSNLKSSLGYGGMIHNFKNLMLRGDPVYVEALTINLAQARKALGQLAPLASDGESAEALDALAAMLATYEAAAAKVSTLHAQGAPLTQISEAIQLDDDAAKAALVTLGTALEARLETQVVLVDKNIRFAETLSLLGGGLVLVLMLGVMVWLKRTLRISALEPAAAVSKAVLALAKGNTGISLEQYVTPTELGQIAAACDTFKRALEDNQSLAAQAKADAARHQQMANEQARMSEEQQTLRDVQAQADTEARELGEHRQTLLSEIDQAVQMAIAGDFTHRLREDYAQTELSSLPRSVNALLSSIGTNISKINGLAQRLAQGDLSQGLSGNFQGEFGALQTGFSSALGQFSETLFDVTEGAEIITGEAQNIAQSASELSSRTEQQSTTLEATAAALEQLTKSVSMVADNAQQAAKEVQTASRYATEGGDTVKTAILAMTQIVEASKRISAVTDLIEDIAFQTNLLALNAGVEAARAGDSGRGFAVVASEVRALAQRSSVAATEINSLISASEAEVEHGSQQVQKAAESIHTIETIVTALDRMVTDVADASAEQATGLASINQSVASLDAVTQQNAKMFEASVASTEMLNRRSQDLLRKASHFNLALKPGSDPLPMAS